ncbi:septum formation initiator family protein [Dialister sp.]|jgi:cell division protein FtsL|uniref:FtsB family cell division protein n=1 Tax=Dialister sp. TaxID=1955814 RepID=UPI0025F3DEC2|nr:cell division protein FtsL [Dialister sp.]
MRKKKTPFLKRLFPHSPLLRIIFVIVMVITSYVVVQNVYHFVKVQQQEAELVKEKARLEEEKENLETQKEDLEDPSKLEKKARDELGLVKPGEVPYVK